MLWRRAWPSFWSTSDRSDAEVGGVFGELFLQGLGGGRKEWVESGMCVAVHKGIGIA